MVCEKNYQLLLFSGVRKKSKPSGSPLSGNTGQVSFPTETVGPWVGIFLAPLNTNDGFYSSHIPVPTRGKSKKLTAARLPHAGHKSIRDVIVML